MTAWLQPGDSYELLRMLPDNSIDSLCSDPPYLLGFMGKKWDKLDGNPAQDPAFWAEVLRVLKPGAYGVAFGAPRTFHRLAVAMEDAGFEIRDSLHWVFGSGFPKSMDLSKALDKAAGAEREVVGSRRLTGTARIKGGRLEKLRSGRNQAWDLYETHELRDALPLTVPATDLAKHWSGWGTALKPAHEPVLLVRKPPVGSIAANVTEWGVGGVNVDGCRIEGGERALMGPCNPRGQGAAYGKFDHSETSVGTTDQGRWPPNVILTHSPECHDHCAECCPVALLDQVSGEAGLARVNALSNFAASDGLFPGGARERQGYTDSGGVSRYFLRARYGPADWLGALYHGKAQKRERNAGVSGWHGPEVTIGRNAENKGANSPRAGANRRGGAANYHPTVKPVEVMRWLVRLVTPPGGVTLDPFLGSGTTAIAAALEGISCVGFDLDPDHVRIAVERLKFRFESTANPQADERQFDLFGDVA